jgi:hypothetical protein
MPRTNRAGWAGWATAVLALAALLPLHGDPRTSPVTHAEWGRLLLRALDMDEVVQASTLASQVFALLSWKDAYSIDAAHYVTGEHVRRLAGRAGLEAISEVAEVRYLVGMVRGGDYRVRLRLRGRPDRPVSLELATAGRVEAQKTFSAAPAATPGWVDLGATHLDAGPYEARILLPFGAVLERIEFAPPCLGPIEPVGGWRAVAIAQTSDVAVTVIQALDAEAELPPAGPPLEIGGAAFEATGGASLVEAGTSFGLRAGPGGVQAVAAVDVPVAGLYTVSAFGLTGRGQSWRADACRKRVVCEALPARAHPEWRELMTASFTAGPHSLAFTLGAGATVERLRLEPRREEAPDYVSALRRLGFDPGPDGPVTREKAVEAARFVASRRRAAPQDACGDVLLELSLRLAERAAPPDTAAPPPAGPAGPDGPPPIGPPVVVPPQPPASPTRP